MGAPHVRAPMRRAAALRPWTFTCGLIILSCSFMLAILFVRVSRPPYSAVLTESRIEAATTPHITRCQHVDGAVWGGYWELETSFVPPYTKGPPNPGPRKGSCHEHASKVRNLSLSMAVTCCTRIGTLLRE